MSEKNTSLAINPIPMLLQKWCNTNSTKKILSREVMFKNILEKSILEKYSDAKMPEDATNLLQRIYETKRIRINNREMACTNLTQYIFVLYDEKCTDIHIKYPYNRAEFKRKTNNCLLENKLNANIFVPPQKEYIVLLSFLLELNHLQANQLLKICSLEPFKRDLQDAICVYSLDHGWDYSKYKNTYSAFTKEVSVALQDENLEACKKAWTDFSIVKERAIEYLHNGSYTRDMLAKFSENTCALENFEDTLTQLIAEKNALFQNTRNTPQYVLFLLLSAHIESNPPYKDSSSYQFVDTRMTPYTFLLDKLKDCYQELFFELITESNLRKCLQGQEDFSRKLFLLICNFLIEHTENTYYQGLFGEEDFATTSKNTNLDYLNRSLVTAGFVPIYQDSIDTLDNWVNLYYKEKTKNPEYSMMQHSKISLKEIAMLNDDYFSWKAFLEKITPQNQNINASYIKNIIALCQSILDDITQNEQANLQYTNKVYALLQSLFSMANFHKNTANQAALEKINPKAYENWSIISKNSLQKLNDTLSQIHLDADIKRWHENKADSLIISYISAALQEFKTELQDLQIDYQDLKAKRKNTDNSKYIHFQ